MLLKMKAMSFFPRTFNKKRNRAATETKHHRPGIE